MTTTPLRSRARSALLAGAATTGYYAIPDLLSTRATRGWAKAGLMAVVLVLSVPDFRAALGSPSEGAERDDEAAPADQAADRPAELSTRAEIAIAAAGSVALTGAVALVVVAERAIFRRGQARAAAGRRLPHTGPAVLYGALAAGLALVPDATPRHDDPAPWGRLVHRGALPRG